MKEYFNIISESELLKDISGDELSNLLNCLNAKIKSYEKNNFILNEGDTVDFIGILLSGLINIVKFDFYGNKNIVLKLKPSDMFAESLIFSKNNKMPFSLETETDCQVLKINGNKILNPCCANCAFHIDLIKNMVSALSDKNSKLTKKINILSLRTTREKILNLLYSETKVQKNAIVTLNMSRQEMADYLSVDRSALSRELSVLKEEKIIDYDRNVFNTYLKN